MKSFVGSVLLMLLTTSAFSQIKLQGKVRDSLNTPLELVNVFAVELESKALGGYGITNEQGVFTIDLRKNTTYNVQISYVGLKSISDTITTGEVDLSKDYIMLPDNVLAFPLDIVDGDLKGTNN